MKLTQYPTRYPARYQDIRGDERTVIENDRRTLRVVIRGVTFAGESFDMLKPEITAPDPRLVPFTFNGDELCGCALECEFPLPVSVDQQTGEGRLWMRLELGGPRADGRYGITSQTLQLCLTFAGQTYCATREQSCFAYALADIQRALPGGTALMTCVTCAFSDYSPYGPDLFGSCLMCFRDNKDGYGQVTDKASLYAIWGTAAESVQETYLCPEYERRQPGMGLWRDRG